MVLLARGAGATADGRELRHGVRAYTNQGIHNAVHESLHLFGLPDLYTGVRGDENPVGQWDPLNFTSFTRDTLAWHKWKIGWLDAAQIECVTAAGTSDHVLAPLEAPGGVKAVVARMDQHTVYVAENRQALGNDAGICKTGVIVYKVDARVPSAEGPIRVQPANSDRGDADQVRRCGTYFNAPLGPLSDRSMFPSWQDKRPSEGPPNIRFELVADGGPNVIVRVTKAAAYEPPPIAAGVFSALRLDRHLRARGTVWSFAPECTGAVTVELQRAAGRSFRTMASARAGANGSYRLRARDRTGRYRVTVDPRSAPGVTCARSLSEVVEHTHRRRRR